MFLCSQLWNTCLFVAIQKAPGYRAKGMVFQETHKSIHGAPEAVLGFKGS